MTSTLNQGFPRVLPKGKERGDQVWEWSGEGRTDWEAAYTFPIFPYWSKFCRKPHPNARRREMQSSCGSEGRGSGCEQPARLCLTHQGFITRLLLCAPRQFFYFLNLCSGIEIWVDGLEMHLASGEWT